MVREIEEFLAGPQDVFFGLWRQVRDARRRRDALLERGVVVVSGSRLFRCHPLGGFASAIEPQAVHHAYYSVAREAADLDCDIGRAPLTLRPELPEEFELFVAPAYGTLRDACAESIDGAIDRRWIPEVPGLFSQEMGNLLPCAAILNVNADRAFYGDRGRNIHLANDSGMMVPHWQHWTLVESALRCRQPFGPQKMQRRNVLRG